MTYSILLEITESVTGSRVDSRKPTYVFRAYLWVLQMGICAWCHHPLTTIKTSHVDHNHRCCNDSLTCGSCVRGLVHRECNMFGITWADWALVNGFYLPASRVDYLTRGEHQLYVYDNAPKWWRGRYETDEAARSCSQETWDADLSAERVYQGWY